MEQIALILFILITTMSWLIVFPIVIYYTYQFWIHRSLDIIAKRQPLVSSSFAIGGSILALITRTYFATISVFNLKSHYILIDICLSGTYFYSALAISILWLLYYHWRKTQQLAKIQWSDNLLLMDKVKNASTRDLPWTLKYGKYVSNQKYLLSVTILYWIICAISLIVLTTYDHANGKLLFNIISISLLFPMVVLGCFLWCKSQKFADIIGLKKQLQHIGIIFCVAFVVASLNILIAPFSTIRICINYGIMQFTMLLICLKFVYIKELQIHRKNKRTRRHSAEKIKYKLTFADIWNNKSLFELFANHCVKEYSIETLLYLFEYSQCKQLIIRNHQLLIENIDQQNNFMNVMNDSKNKKNSFEISLDILKLKDDTYLKIVDCVKLFTYLYDSYIDPISVTQVNISGHARQNVVDAFCKHNLVQSKKIYAKTRKQMLPIVVIHSFHESEQHSKKNDGVSAIDHQISSMLLEIIQSFDAVSRELFVLLKKDSWRRFMTTDKYILANENA